MSTQTQQSGINTHPHESLVETAVEVVPESETVVAPVLETNAADAPVLPELDAEAVVEEAELLLRESAPHDFDVLVIGAGPGGCSAAIRASELGARVGLVEAAEIGGSYLNGGCIPFQTLRESANVLRLLRRAGKFGITTTGRLQVDWPAIVARQEQIVRQLKDELVRSIQSRHIEVIRGRARFVDEHGVEITGDGFVRHVQAVYVIIATGSQPSRPDIPGADLPGVVTSNGLLRQAAIPARLVVSGAAATGVEFACLYRQLGSDVTLLSPPSRLLPDEDADVSLEIARALRDGDVNVVFGAHRRAIHQDGERLVVGYTCSTGEHQVEADLVLLTEKRRAHTDELGLDEIGVTRQDNNIVVDEHGETNIKGVYAIGDCVRGNSWAHQAAAEGKVVAEYAMNHPATMSLSHMPRCYYTYPEVATVGLMETAARQLGVPVRVGVHRFEANSRAVIAGDAEGFVKVIISNETDQLLGCQIVGPLASDLINEAVLFLKSGQTVDQWSGAIYTPPSYSETLLAAIRAAGDKRL